MNPVEPELHQDARLVVFAKNQPPYIPLPAAVSDDGTVVTEWALTTNELQALLEGGHLRLTILFVDLNKPFTPIKLEVVK